LNLKKIAVLREICSTFSVPVIDCYSECGIRAEDEIWGERGRYLKDGLHPDVEGQQLMGRYIAKKIQNYLGGKLSTDIKKGSTP
jgi:lysophospholipase L1-like esterase